ncbi:MAG: divalent-cation tolerance protein CutA [Dolichospermum sp.]|jgi:periplasmic divalent cation tolerance protein|nr:divalent-cation tolerance protein CutA [Dolichospermum circinale]MDB9454321.1 divalent-cation tolerance protein CutA [Dolichospermum circinale CS-541/06]MDB9463474.1 divalent-cation tolerance protein CutA [Dolichospermum circinale CS-541/04]MDB9546243.1 divalent-cation tolerance protein CutA [Dolichospermum circinale CS-1031]
MEFIFVYITCKDRVEALNIGKAVVEARLAACANIIDGMDSIYWWNDELQVEKEAILIMKSRGDLLEELTETVKSKHSYEVPCVVALPIKQGNQDYLNWLIAETKAKQISTNS